MKFLLLVIAIPAFISLGFKCSPPPDPETDCYHAIFNQVLNLHVNDFTLLRDSEVELLEDLGWRIRKADASKCAVDTE